MSDHLQPEDIVGDWLYSPNEECTLLLARFYRPDGLDELGRKLDVTWFDNEQANSDLTDEDGVALTALLDWFQADYDVTQRDARKALDILYERGDISNNTPGRIKLA